MEVYVLDSLLRRTEVVDMFDSLIWTERFSELGDFELQLKSTLQNRSLLVPGTQLAINNSYRVMTVETVEDSTDTNGKEVLKIKGRSLEAMLMDRIAKESMETIISKWILSGRPGDIARAMFTHICINGALSPNDVIPFIQSGTIFPTGTLGEPETPIYWEQSPDGLYNAIKNLVELYDLGFRLVRNFDQSELYFDVYAGNDRTSRQSLLTPVIFSVHLDTIQNTTEFSSIQGSKNVAYVFSDVGFEIVYGEGVDSDVAGFERRVLGVNANDITADNPDISGALIQRGNEELARSRAIELFDGELNQYNEYKYGTDYELGDIVEMRNKDGNVSYKRVTEQIFACDESGERSYPTLLMDLFAGANTWLSFENDPRVWSDFDAEFWSEM